ncbi:MAG: CtsR family transcriptional regulator, partial [Oscillospiraceae bacterium]
MANISDIIAGAILEMLTTNDIAEIQRNDFAEKIGCVPSQINYVLTSRFKPEQGFIIESRRGGGGFIRIKKLNFCEDKAGQIMHIVNSIGDYIDISSCNIILKNMITRELISICTAQV